MLMRDLYWLAGIVEGEGCFKIRRNKNNALRVAVQMTDKDVVERVAHLFGVRCLGPYKTTHKPIYRAEISQTRRAAAFMMTLYPLMGQRRRQRITELLHTFA